MPEPLETRCIKRAVKREEGYPIGSPAPLYILCGCGSKVMVLPYHDCHCVVCHTVYDHEGYVLAEITIHRCKACGREESVCSDDPCAAVLEDRGESIAAIKLTPADVVMLAHAAKVKW
ncbi:MAG TPA: hypothetical protein VMQ76_04040 [Terracidiphilus sp.]|jgi:hypothetical protein|nr:hypothetical protein [Terracidiphilus sp.]